MTVYTAGWLAGQLAAGVVAGTGSRYSNNNNNWSRFNVIFI